MTEIYDIGTEILYFQCFVTTDMFLFRKPISLVGSAAFFEIMRLAVSKHDLKRSCKSQFFGLNSLVGSCRGRFPTKISFDICSRQALSMRNSFFMFPKPEQLNYSDFFNVLNVEHFSPKITKT